MTDYKRFPRVPRDNFVLEVVSTLSALVVMLLLMAMMIWSLLPNNAPPAPLATDMQMLKMYTADALARHTEQTNAHFEAIARGQK